jgi:spermidine/putrescine transport system substrate-binding protein
MPRSGRAAVPALVLALAIAAAACGSDGEPAAEGGAGDDAAAAFPSSAAAAEDAGPLKLLEWEGYELPDFHQGFEETYGDVKLQYQYAAAGSEFFSKVQAGGVEVDVVHPCSNWVQDWKDADLIAPIDTSRLENWDSLNPQLREMGEVDGQQWFIPWDWGYESLIVNTETAPIELDSWADLWDPQLQGQFSMEDFGEGAVKMASLAYDLPYPNLSQDDLDTVRARLDELKPNIRTLWGSSSDLVQQMTSGDVSVGFGWNDQFARIKDAGTPVDYITPEEGRMGWACGFMILKDTQHYDLALKYIDSAISPESCAAAIDQYFLGCSNTEALEIADPKNVEVLQLDQEDVLAATDFAEPLTPQQRTQFNQVWTQVTAGLGG